MFTLKLFYRKENGDLVTSILPCHHVQVREFKDVDAGTSDCKAMELWAFDGPEPSPYKSFLIGEIIADRRNGGWYGWGLLENWEGNTTQHFRPASYG
jgi:hypothetical protein